MRDIRGGEADNRKFTVTGETRGSYHARDEAGGLVLLVPVTNTRPPVERAAGDVVIGFRQGMQFDVPDGSFQSNAAVIRCGKAELAETFEVLAKDVAQKVDVASSRPTPHEVSDAIALWEQLLRSRRSLSREEEIGLWGELWFLLHLDDADTAVSVWRGPEAEYVDFVGGGIGVECKTSVRRHEHYISQEQVTRPLGDLSVFLLSLWVGIDATAGKTVNQLVAEIEGNLDERRDFEVKLLETGYSRADAHQYKIRLRELEPPTLFPIEVVPRVREADAGVSRIRFLANLDEREAIDQARALGTLMRLCG